MTVPSCIVPVIDGGILFPCGQGGTMGQVLHRSATTTAAVRRAIRHSQESLSMLARRQIGHHTICWMFAR